MAQTILVVDDNEVIRVIASKILADAGYVPFSAPDGKAALQLLDSHVFDLVIVDFVMPGMLGDDFVRCLRNHRNAAVRQIPVLGLSGSRRDAEALFGAAGATDHLSKPLAEPTLLEAVRRVLPHASSASCEQPTSRGNRAHRTA
ncbi:MAG TPA: response regulator [Anaeromyxobacteraceae bacterium]|nr:response regulator [Anaeromyxobacteraceae bacterium]